MIELHPVVVIFVSNDFIPCAGTLFEDFKKLAELDVTAFVIIDHFNDPLNLDPVVNESKSDQRIFQLRDANLPRLVLVYDVEVLP